VQRCEALKFRKYFIQFVIAGCTVAPASVLTATGQVNGDGEF